MTRLLEPCQLGTISLKNRVVMAPMTRSRSTDDGTPTDMMIDYYRQRASAGLIISGGVAPNIAGWGAPCSTFYPVSKVKRYRVRDCAP